MNRKKVGSSCPLASSGSLVSGFTVNLPVALENGKPVLNHRRDAPPVPALQRFPRVRHRRLRIKSRGPARPKQGRTQATPSGSAAEIRQSCSRTGRRAAAPARPPETLGPARSFLHRARPLTRPLGLAEFRVRLPGPAPSAAASGGYRSGGWCAAQTRGLPRCVPTTAALVERLPATGSVRAGRTRLHHSLRCLRRRPRVARRARCSS